MGEGGRGGYGGGGRRESDDRQRKYVIIDYVLLCEGVDQLWQNVSLDYCLCQISVVVGQSPQS